MSSIECGGNVETSWGALSIARPQHNNNNNNNIHHLALSVEVMLRHHEEHYQ